MKTMKKSLGMPKMMKGMAGEMREDIHADKALLKALKSKPKSRKKTSRGK